jgi:hypothetical protein
LKEPRHSSAKQRACHKIRSACSNESAWQEVALERRDFTDFFDDVAKTWGLVSVKTDSLDFFNDVFNNSDGD